MLNGVHVDPLKDANSQDVHLANHTTTLAIEYARQGLDWEEALRQRAKEIALMQELGLAAATSTDDETDDEPSNDEEEDEPSNDDEEDDARAA